MKFSIKEYLGQYRLFVKPKESSEETFVWESESREECLQIEPLYQQWFTLKENFNKQTLRSSQRLGNGNKPGNLQGVELRIGRDKHGSPGVQALFEKERIGFLDIDVNPFASFLALQQITTSSGEWIDEQWKGKGLCARMYQFLEENTKISPVPHGKLAFFGYQSTDSKNFWEKRARHHYVPGFNDPITDQRIDKILMVNSLYDISNEVHLRYNSKINTALALQAGLKISVLVDRYESSKMAFCPINDHQALCGAGIVTIDRAKSEILELYGLEYSFNTFEPAEFIQVNREKCKQLNTDEHLYYAQKVSRGEISWRDIREAGIIRDKVEEYNTAIADYQGVAKEIIKRASNRLETIQTNLIIDQPNSFIA